MSWVKELLYEMEEERKTIAMEQLSKHASDQAEQLASLQAQVREANSIKSKLKDWLAGGLVGATLGYLLSYIL